MRYSESKKALFGLMMIFIASVAFCAQSGESEKYNSWHEDGVFYRFDNSTGEIHKLVKPITGPPMWVKCEVKDTTQPATPVAARALPTAPNIPGPHPQAHPSFTTPTGNTVSSAQAGMIIDPGTMPTINPDPVAPKQIVAARRKIEVFNEKDERITDVIDDAERAKSRPEINAYDALHVSSTLKTVGDRIKGTLMLNNKGNRRIDVMELTMTVRVMGKEKPIEHTRIIFADKAGSQKPPEPSFGGSSLSVMQTVDVPMPSGVLNGMPEVKVSYIHFDDRE